MSEKRRAAFIINFQRGREGRGKLEIFRKSCWTDQPEDKYEYRLRLNNKWLCGTHGDRRFVKRDQIMPIVLKELAKEDIL